MSKMQQVVEFIPGISQRPKQLFLAQILQCCFDIVGLATERCLIWNCRWQFQVPNVHFLGPKLHPQ